MPPRARILDDQVTKILLPLSSLSTTISHDRTSPESIYVSMVWSIGSTLWTSADRGRSKEERVDSLDPDFLEPLAAEDNVEMLFFADHRWVSGGLGADSNGHVAESLETSVA